MGVTAVVAGVGVGVGLLAIGALRRCRVLLAGVADGNDADFNFVSGLVVRDTGVDFVLEVDTPADREAFNQAVAHLDGGGGGGGVDSCVD